MSIITKILVYGAIIAAVGILGYWLFQTFTYTPPKDTTPIVPPKVQPRVETPDEQAQRMYCETHATTKGCLPL